MRPTIIRQFRRVSQPACGPSSPSAKKYGVDLPTAALQFVYAHPAVATVVQGVRNVEELVRNVQAISTSVPSEFWAELKAAGIIPNEVPVDKPEALA